MGRVGVVVGLLAVLPVEAWATACSTYGLTGNPMNCQERVGWQNTVIDVASESKSLNDYHTCDPSPQGGPERIFPFTCARSNWVRIEMWDTECDLDVFVLRDTCNPGTCLAYNTDSFTGSVAGRTNRFWCETGRTYWVVVEGWDLVNRPWLCPTKRRSSTGEEGKGSNFKVRGICDELCDDGFDNDRDGLTDCADPDCGAGGPNGPHPACCDRDGDGYFAVGGFCGGDDCDDDDPTIHPAAVEVPDDGIDQDCDGRELCWVDGDGDGFGGPTERTTDLDCTGPRHVDVGGDCDDADPDVFPGADEIPVDGIDQDCDGRELCHRDLDRDRWGTDDLVTSADLDCDDGGEAWVDGDCDDADPRVYPGAPEIVADGVDQDCDGRDTCWLDADRDGWGGGSTVLGADLTCTGPGESTRTGDCNDADPGAWPGAPEIPYDGIDQDCDGADLDDLDGDGFRGGPGGNDCNDRDASVHPGAQEIVADGIDQDCSGGDLCWRDADGDGFGGTRTVASADLDCLDPGESDRSDDCDDEDARRYPGAREIPYDGIDQDCDGADLDDLDRDGFPGGRFGADCNDNAASVHPGATERANGVDDDCDGVVDEGTTWYDDDGDGWTEVAGDCNDADPSVHPGAREVPNHKDDDCDGLVDEGTAWYDDDGDGWTELQGDCNDADPTVHPGATEREGEGIDRDCDGRISGGDGDRDGFTVRGGDCDDTNAQVHPGAREVANGVDDDCDGVVDEGTEAYDDDGDGFCEVATASCPGGDCDDTRFGRNPAVPEDPTNRIDDDCDGDIDEGGPHWDGDGDGWTPAGGDCDDTNPAIHPYAPEVPNGVDDDCDGGIDDAKVDVDRDGWTVEAGDCDDADGWANPERREVCDGIDNDCDGEVDEGCEEEDAPATPAGRCQTGGAPPGAALALLGLLLVRRRR